MSVTAPPLTTPPQTTAIRHQAGKLKCLNAIHVYGNDPHSSSAQVGLKTHIYNSCGSTGCGPNSCCCVNAGAPLDYVGAKLKPQLAKAIAPLKQTTDTLAKTVDALGLQGNNFLADGALAQSMMEVRRSLL